MRSAYENEELLRGGRLFCDPSVADAGRKFGGEVYEWKELTAWELEPEKARLEIDEVLWPIEVNQQVLKQRAECAIDLYESSLRKFLQQEPDADPRKIMPSFLHYDETLKLMLRSVGASLRSNGDSEAVLGPIIEGFLAYKLEHFRFTWGVIFVALEAAFIGQHSCAREFAASVADILNQKYQDVRQRSYVDDFIRETKRPTYASFGEWFTKVIQ